MQTPSNPTLPASISRPPNSVPLPSGLGAGGRGKEKAPCRYLHFEVDWDETESPSPDFKRIVRKFNNDKLPIGLGPEGVMKPLVRSYSLLSSTLVMLISTATAAMDQLRLTTL